MFLAVMAMMMKWGEHFLNGQRSKGTWQILEWEQDSWFVSSSALTLCDPGSVPCPLWTRVSKSRGGGLGSISSWNPLPLCPLPRTPTQGAPGSRGSSPDGPGGQDGGPGGVKTAEFPFPTPTSLALGPILEYTQGRGSRRKGGEMV